METQERRKTFALHRNDVLVAKLWVWRRNSEAPLWYHTPLSTFVGLGTGGLENSCPKLLRLGLRLSMSFMGSSRSYTKAQQPDPLQRGQDTLMHRCALEMLWVYWNWQFSGPHFISQRGRWPFTWVSSFYQDSCFPRPSLYLHCAGAHDLQGPSQFGFANSYSSYKT